MTWWAEYPERSAGRVIHFVYYYCNLHIAEEIRIGNGSIEYWKYKDFATFTHENVTVNNETFLIPVFIFKNDLYNQGQEIKQKIAIIHLKEYEERKGPKQKWKDLEEANEQQKSLMDKNIQTHIHRWKT